MSNPSAFTWNIDLIPPITTIDSRVSAMTASTTATFTFTSNEANSTFECLLDGGAFVSCASPKIWSSLTMGSHTFRVRAIDAAGNVDATPASYTWERGVLLTVYFDGVGAGTVTETTGGYSSIGAYSQPYSWNTGIKLIATPDGYSYFYGWSDSCTNKTGNCSLKMDSDKVVTATFSVMPPLRIISTGTNYFETLLSAYATAQDGKAITIDARALDLKEHLDFNRNVFVTLKGGYSVDFTSQTGATTIQGKLTIGKGSLVVDRVIIK